MGSRTGNRRGKEQDWDKDKDQDDDEREFGGVGRRSRPQRFAQWGGQAGRMRRRKRGNPIPPSSLPPQPSQRPLKRL